MRLEPISPTHGILEIDNILPAEISPSIIPGSKVSYAEGPFGTLTLQEVPAGAYCIHNNAFKTVENCSFRFTSDQPELQILIALHGCCAYVIEGIDEFLLEQGQFIIFYSPSVESTLYLSKSKELILFQLRFPLEVVNHYLGIFPVLQRFIDEILQEKATILFQKPGWINEEILETVNSFFMHPVEEKFLTFLFEVYTKNLFMLLFLQKNQSGEISISQKDLEAIQRTRHIIESHVGRILTIKRITRLANIKASTLKKYFKSVVGCSVAEFIKLARLRNAKLLIQESELPIGEIASILGYEHIADFSQAFKKLFDYTPLSMRKKRQ